MSWLVAVVSIAAMAFVGHTVAQQERQGLRVHYASIGASAGLEGRAFVPVPTGRVGFGKSVDPACASTVELSAAGTLPRGPLRGVSLRVRVSEAGGRVELGVKGCALAEVETTLEDGTVLKGGRGHIELSRRAGTADPMLRGSFSQTVLRSGVPVTIDGTFALGTPPL